MSDSATKTDLDEMGSRLQLEVSNASSELRSEMSQMGTELRSEISEMRSELKTEIGTSQNEILGVLRDLMERFDERFARLEETYDDILSGLDKSASQVDDYETEQAARDNQFQRLVTWAHVVGKKVDVPLKDL